MPAPTDVIRMLRDLRRDVDALKRTSPLANSGLSVTDQGELTMSGNLIVTGDFTAQGKIDNDALVSPVYTDSVMGTATNFAVTHTGTAPLVSTDWVIPAGFSQCNIMMAVRVFAMNGSGVKDYLNARPHIVVNSSGATFDGAGLQLPVPNGDPGLNTSFVSVEARQLVPGTTITLAAQAWTNGSSGWAANAINYAEFTAQLLWTR